MHEVNAPTIAMPEARLTLGVGTISSQILRVTEAAMRLALVRRPVEHLTKIGRPE